MRISTIVFAAVGLLLVTGWAVAGIQPNDPGGFLGYKPKKVGKDYYVVRKGQSDKCSIEAGKMEKKPDGAIGGAPYASKDYAKAALKKFPECKGGEADESIDTKKHGKKGE